MKTAHAAAPMPAHAEDTMSFGELLRALRVAKGLRQLDLGLRVYLDHSVISKLETGLRAPQRADVERLATALELSNEEHSHLVVAYEREVVQRGELHSDVLLHSVDLLELAREQVDEARDYRLSGEPQFGASTALRSAAWLRLMSRHTQSGSTHSILLEMLMRALVEQSKSYLDFVTPQQVSVMTAGLLSEQATIVAYLRDQRLLQVHSMTLEGILYLQRAYHRAHELSIKILGMGALNPEWQPEQLRAAAINAGYVRDQRRLHEVAKQVMHLIETSADLKSTEVVFLLEGIARGQALLLEPECLTTLDRAWNELERGRRVGGFSNLRLVQLIRAHLVALGQLGATLTDSDERLGARGLAISQAHGYERHHHEISRLLTTSSS